MTRLQARRRRRAERRLAVANGVRVPVAPSVKAVDPLQRPARPGSTRAGVVVIFVAAAVLAHATLLAFGLAAGRLAAIGRADAPVTRERIELRVVDEPSPPPAATEDAAPAATPRAGPAPRPKPAAADPVDPPEDAPPAAEPRRIVGLSMESTVSAGPAPSFAVGNTRMGETADVAADPSAVEKLPNRVATRVPTGARVVAPRKLATVTPEYLRALKAQGIEGDVVLRVDIGADGVVSAVAVIKGSGHVELDDAARRAAAAERYVPAHKDGTAVADTITFTVRFRLTEA